DLVGLVNEQHPERTDMSVLLESRAVSLPPEGAETHSFQLFLGPKRPELLAALNARGIITFGWFSFVSVGMVYALNFFHHVFRLPYGLAIVLLTLIVRACMFPITRKQATGAKKMKELQPKLQELKTKYAKEPEKFWQAQRELFRKHNYSPLSGCLPLVLQLPIFIGLYNALSFDVDLRMARFLWIDNLAAPDALFGFGRELPFVHWTHFNLLPLITICLWVVQQKMFMPPPATEEQALQYKVMNYMMIFIGFMIYRVPAGLCVYFITSTLWGISERKAIDYLKIGEKKTTEDEPIEATATPVSAPSAPEAPRPPGLLERLFAAADQAKAQGTGRANESSGSANGASRKDQRSGKKKRR
ncbi:MAG: membrane protein insertase YidC, partial [Planctomycetaceae bacterium]|nr:membrane protein insertase YidC [Planctomycetaceae bacterium]